MKENNYILATIHRDSNTDDLSRLREILVTLKSLAEENEYKTCDAVASKDNYIA